MHYIRYTLAASLILFLLCLCFFLRMSNHYYAVEDEDGNTEYLIASHIVQYDEFPLIGESVSKAAFLKHNVTYYYLLALLLLVHHTILWIGQVNAIMQFFTVICTTLIAYYCFGEVAAIIALALATGNATLITASRYVWQPHIVLPFALLAFLFLVLADRKESVGLLITSIFFCIFSSALYSALLFTMPLYLLFSVSLLRSWKVEKKTYSITAVFTCLFFILFFGSEVYYYAAIIHITNPITLLHGKSSHFLLPRILQSFFSSSIFFLHDFLLPAGFFSGFFIIGESIAVIAALFFSKERKYQYVLLVLLLTGISIFSFFREDQQDLSRHLFPMYGFFIIFVAGVLAQLYKRHWILRIVICFFIGMLMLTNVPPSRLLSLQVSRSARGNEVIPILRFAPGLG